MQEAKRSTQFGLHSALSIARSAHKILNAQVSDTTEA